MPSTPTLAQVEADLSRIAAMAPRLATQARWAWPLAYSHLRGAGGSTGEVRRPVEAAVATEGAPAWTVRTEVARAGALVGEAHQALAKAIGCLSRAQAAADVAAAAGATTLDEADGPPMVNKAELAAAKAARARREARRRPGEGYGQT